MRSMYKLKWCICSDNRCKQYLINFMKIVVQDANGSVHFLPFSISCHHFIEQKKFWCDFKNPKHFNFRSFIKIILKEKNKVYSSRIRTGRSFLLSFLLLFVAMPHNDIYLLIWSHYGKWVWNFYRNKKKS